MSNVIDATPRFARRTAEACMNLWTREQTIANVARLGEDHEEEVVRQIEQLQLEKMMGDD